MVKLGFITEGAVEKMILESGDFKTLLSELNIDFIPEVINTEGNGNLLPFNIEKYTQVLLDKGATKIIILTDLDNEVCITLTKERIQPRENHIVIVSVKQIEAWFMADMQAMKSFLKSNVYNVTDPELYPVPFEEIKNIRKQLTGRGVNDKKIFAKLMISQNAFSIKRAAQHPNCNSAKYLIAKLRQLAEQELK